MANSSMSISRRVCLSNGLNQGKILTDSTTGNVLMLSEGRNGTDNTYSLKDGVLRLNLDKATYERAGLTGKPVRSGGQKHVKERYGALQQPSYDSVEL